MIPRECKRLIEVDFPIAAVSAHSAREKSIRHGHPSTFHLWWARRPLAACRAVMMGLLLPDPEDPLCPDAFKVEARRLLAGIEGAGSTTDLDLRRALLDFIAEFSNWDNSGEEHYLTRAGALVTAAHPAETPLVVDPFAGGGSIPLEALRIGCEALASDLNPVACLILKVLLEDIPRHGPQLAGELRKIGAEIGAAAEKELGKFYPPDPDGARPIAYLWARTVRCESPNCGAEIALARSFWLSKKAGRRRALRWRLERPKKGPPEVVFEMFEPKQEKEVPRGTVARAKATCLVCSTVLPPNRVRAQLAARRGGADVEFDSKGNRVGGARLLAVVTLKMGDVGRRYRLPTGRDYEAVRRATEELEKTVAKDRRKLLPDEHISTPLGREFRPDDPYSSSIKVLNYGITRWAHLYTQRQRLALSTLVELASRTRSGTPDANVSPLSEACALAISRCADYNSAQARWVTSGEFVGNTFGRHAIGIVWDFCEVFPFSSESGGFGGAVDWIARVAENLGAKVSRSAHVSLADARTCPLPDSSADVWFTDPPYYDAVGYAELSDFFYVWLKRILPGHPLLRDPFDMHNPLTPKD